MSHVFREGTVDEFDGVGVVGDVDGRDDDGDSGDDVGG